MRACLFALCAVLGAACQQSRAAAVVSEDVALIDKMNLYVNCLNTVDKEVFKSRDNYLLDSAGRPRMDPDRGPTDKEVTYAGPLALSAVQIKACTDGLLQAAEMKPRLSRLEAAGENYQRALGKLEPLVREAHEYYDLREYKDDELARGREMHGSLISAWNEFTSADTKLRAELDTVQAELDARELARLEKKAALEFHSKRLMKQAEVLAKTLATDRTSGALPGAIENFVSAHAAFVDYRATHPGSDDQAQGSVPTFEAEARSVLAHAKEISRALRDGRDLPASGDGSLDGFIEDYNRLVNAWNGLRWVR